MTERRFRWRDTRLITAGGHVDIVQDAKYPQMWRVRYPDGHLSDMVNLTRARDAARRTLLAILDRSQRAPETPTVH